MPEDNNDINNPHDSGYKYLLYSKKAFVQLIRSFVKTGWAEQFDEASLVRIDMIKPLSYKILRTRKLTWFTRLS